MLIIAFMESYQSSNSLTNGGALNGTKILVDFRRKVVWRYDRLFSAIRRNGELLRARIEVSEAGSKSWSRITTSAAPDHIKESLQCIIQWVFPCSSAHCCVHRAPAVCTQTEDTYTIFRILRWLSGRYEALGMERGRTRWLCRNVMKIKKIISGTFGEHCASAPQIQRQQLLSNNMKDVQRIEQMFAMKSIPHEPSHTRKKH